MNKVNIKTITKKEFGEFYKLFSSLVKTQFSEYSKKSIEWMLTSKRAFEKESMQKAIKNKQMMTIGAYVSDAIVGFAYGELPFGGLSRVYWLAIDPIFQRKGIGRALLGKWEEIVKNLGVHAVHLYSAQHNINFYKKLGYKIIGFDEKSYFGQDCYIFKKIIQEPKEENFLRE
ncbi:GNAT family N-acetyltransferase [Candidatus Microgenomates bacterium]|nr:GNAT family N-acetyltransferase [Candidatus Microgenomates bacterium]